jgi:lantibiotic transport system permease protein
MNLLISVRSEILKTKRTSSFYLTIIAAAFGPFATMLDILIGEGISQGDRNVIFNALFVDKFQMTGLLAFPMFLILICTLLPQIEYKNNAWKQVLISPKSKAEIFISKFINIQLLILVFLVVNFLLMFLCAVFLHLKEPSLHVLNQSLNGYDIIMLRINSYVSLLGLCAIHFWLGLRFKNFIIPIGIGIACYFAGNIAIMQYGQSLIIYSPYTIFIYSGLPEYAAHVNAVNWYSLGYAVLFLTIGFLDFRRKRMSA